MTQQQPANTSPRTAVLGAAYTRAMELLRAGRLEETRIVCMEILALSPKQPDAYTILAAVAHQSRDSATAVTNFQKALKLDPNNLSIRLNLAKTHRDFAQWADAAKAFEAVLKKMPNDGPVLYDLGKAYGHLARHGDAVRCYRRALDLKPGDDIIETDLASALMKHGDIAAADTHYTAVISRSPHFVPALINLAILRDVQGRLDEALALFEDVLRFEPDNADAHFHHALGLIARERLTEGWAEYIWRFQRPKATTLHDRFPVPYWNGEPLQDRTLLIWTEQGLGDEILLASMIPDIFARGGRCTIVCTKRLSSLFQRTFPDAKVLTREDMKADAAPAAGADYQASLSQLGLHLRPSAASFPSRVAFMTADVEKTATLRRRYRGDSTDRLVGIAWHSANPQASAEKSIPLQAWEEILRVPGYRFVSLQYGDQSHAHRALRTATGLELIIDKTVSTETDFEDFAAQVGAMDLVISVSNTTVHMAGALGIPVWTLLPASLGRIWYWFLNRNDSPWYPSMRLFRQQRGSDWAPTLSAVARELRQWP